MGIFEIFKRKEENKEETKKDILEKGWLWISLIIRAENYSDEDEEYLRILQDSLDEGDGESNKIKLIKVSNLGSLDSFLLKKPKKSKEDMGKENNEFLSEAIPQLLKLLPQLQNKVKKEAKNNKAHTLNITLFQ